MCLDGEETLQHLDGRPCAYLAAGAQRPPFAPVSRAPYPAFLAPRHSPLFFTSLREIVDPQEQGSAPTRVLSFAGSGMLLRPLCLYFSSNIVDSSDGYALYVFEKFFRIGVADASWDRDPSSVNGLHLVSTFTRATESAVSVSGLPLWLWLLAQAPAAQSCKAYTDFCFDTVDDISFLILSRFAIPARWGFEESGYCKDEARE